jgi:hypothetical protein
MLLCGIIKPHALPHSREILETLINADIVVEKTKCILYTQELVEVLYDHMSLEARQGIGRQLSGLHGLAVLLRVPSIERLLDVVGRESDPSKCKLGTIRACFGIHEAPQQIGNKCGNEWWWENAFHRPIDEREAARDLLHIFNVSLE